MPELKTDYFYHSHSKIFYVTRNVPVLSQRRYFGAKNGCAKLRLVDGFRYVNPIIPQASWFQTPSVIEMGAGKSKTILVNLLLYFIFSGRYLKSRDTQGDNSLLLVPPTYFMLLVPSCEQSKT